MMCVCVRKREREREIMREILFETADDISGLSLGKNAHVHIYTILYKTLEVLSVY